jgi:hypothetical protein
MNKMHHNHGLPIALLAGVSVVALAAAAPSAGAADLNKPALAKAPPPAPIAKDTWTWWIEGGAINTSGGDFNFGAPGLGIRPQWGPEGAVGFDWQPFAADARRRPVPLWFGIKEPTVRCFGGVPRRDHRDGGW